MATNRSSGMEQTCLEAIGDLVALRVASGLLFLPTSQAGRDLANADAVRTRCRPTLS